MNQKLLDQDVETLEFYDNIDTYHSEYAEQLLDDDALDVEEVAFLSGYNDF